MIGLLRSLIGSTPSVPAGYPPAPDRYQGGCSDHSRRKAMTLLNMMSGVAVSTTDLRHLLGPGVPAVTSSACGRSLTFKQGGAHVLPLSMGAMKASGASGGQSRHTCSLQTELSSCSRVSSLGRALANRFTVPSELVPPILRVFLLVDCHSNYLSEPFPECVRAADFAGDSAHQMQIRIPGYGCVATSYYRLERRSHQLLFGSWNSQLRGFAPPRSNGLACRPDNLFRFHL